MLVESTLIAIFLSLLCRQWEFRFRPFVKLRKWWRTAYSARIRIPMEALSHAARMLNSLRFQDDEHTKNKTPTHAIEVILLSI